MFIIFLVRDRCCFNESLETILQKGEVGGAQLAVLKSLANPCPEVCEGTEIFI
jgi:hypothetical protein